MCWAPGGVTPRGPPGPMPGPGRTEMGWPGSGQCCGVACTSLWSCWLCSGGWQSAACILRPSNQRDARGGVGLTRSGSWGCLLCDPQRGRLWDTGFSLESGRQLLGGNVLSCGREGSQPALLGSSWLLPTDPRPLLGSEALQTPARGHMRVGVLC